MGLFNGPAGGAIVGTALNTVDFGMNYMQRRKEHPTESTASSLVKGAGTWAVQQALWTYASPLMWGSFAAQTAYGLGTVGYEMYRRGPSTRNYNAYFGGNYMDTQMNATMRQRGVMAIQNSRLNARSVLGNEARSLHNSRSY